MLAPGRQTQQQHLQNKHTRMPVACQLSVLHMPQVLLKGDERLAEVISQYVSDSRADLLVTGSQNLCVDGESRSYAFQWRCFPGAFEPYAVHTHILHACLVHLDWKHDCKGILCRVLQAPGVTPCRPQVPLPCGWSRTCVTALCWLSRPTARGLMYVPPAQP